MAPRAGVLIPSSSSPPSDPSDPCDLPDPSDQSVPANGLGGLRKEGKSESGEALDLESFASTASSHAPSGHTGLNMVALRRLASASPSSASIEALPSSASSSTGSTAVLAAMAAAMAVAAATASGSLSSSSTGLRLESGQLANSMAGANSLSTMMATTAAFNELFAAAGAGSAGCSASLPSLGALLGLGLGPVELARLLEQPEAGPVWLSRESEGLRVRMTNEDKPTCQTLGRRPALRSSVAGPIETSACLQDRVGAGLSGQSDLGESTGVPMVAEMGVAGLMMPVPAGPNGRG
ncbi:unnamed protein product [Protopolystoma xenopodis]|uniref:Uncharacterized protein n=1 Tax=Protopolystoma xenopodis TaxID=117903 RepID=A0A3S5C1T3_9PLAT|nr:unnamed protein product [Protopolystoma xenopodis]